MEQMQEGLITVEQNDLQQGRSAILPVPPIGGVSATGADDLEIKQLTPKINRQQAAAIRMLKGSLRAMLRTGMALTEVQGILGSEFPHWVRTKLSLTPAEADFIVRFSSAKSGLNEEDLTPIQEVKLSRLLEILEQFVGMWQDDNLAGRPTETAERASVDAVAGQGMPRNIA